MTLRVFVVDEQELTRLGISAAVKETDDMEIAGQSNTVKSALLRVPTVKPDVVVIGTAFEVGSGVHLCRDLVDRSGARVLIITAATDDDTMIAAFLAGAAGYVASGITAARLVAAIRTAAGGSTLLNPSAAAAVMQRLRAQPHAAGMFDELTHQEHEVLKCIGESMTNRQIAEKLFMAEKTVKNYVSRILAKVGMNSRTQVAVAVHTRGH